MASVSCASLEMEPYDMAPVAKRLTISEAGSTASSGIGARPISAADLIRNNPRSVFSWCSCRFTSSAYSR